MKVQWKMVDFQLMEVIWSQWVSTMTVYQYLSTNCVRIMNTTTMKRQINASLAPSHALSASFRATGAPLAYRSTTSPPVIHASTASNTACSAKIAASVTNAFLNTTSQILLVSFANQFLTDASFVLTLQFASPALAMGIGIWATKVFATALKGLSILMAVVRLVLNIVCSAWIHRNVYNATLISTGSSGRTIASVPEDTTSHKASACPANWDASTASQTKFALLVIPLRTGSSKTSHVSVNQEVFSTKITA